MLALFPLTLALVLWKQRGKRWRGAAVCLGWTALAAAACCLCPSVYALVLVTMAGLVLGLFFALRDWLGLGRKKPDYPPDYPHLTQDLWKVNF